MSFDLVEVEGERRIDSRIVAKGIHVQHDNLMQTINKYRPGVEKYGILLFETGKIKKRGRPEQYVLLNKEQFGYLLMFVRVTETVRAYREDVYDKFLAYERIQQGMPVQPLPAPAIPAINSLWEQRLIDFNRKTHLPTGYWSVFGMVAGHCWADEFRGVHLVEEALPDGSIGKRWCQYLRSQSYDMGLIKKYLHHYPDKRGTQPANIYPNEWLGAFWTWFHGTYLTVYYPNYLKTHTLALPDAQEKKVLPYYSSSPDSKNFG